MNPNITFTGNLTDNPEASSKVDKTRIRVATNDRVQVDGEWTDKNTSFWTVECWGNLGKKVAEHLEKGDGVVVTGRIMADNYTNKDGVEVKAYAIRADDVGLSLAKYRP